MAEPIFHYDEESDTLHVSFTPGEAATGIALNDHMLLRINKHERRAIGLTLFAYPVLAQSTEVGPRSFPLTGLMQLSDALRAPGLDLPPRPRGCHLPPLSPYAPSPAAPVAPPPAPPG